MFGRGVGEMVMVGIGNRGGCCDRTEEGGGLVKKLKVDIKDGKAKNQKVVGMVMERILGIEDVMGCEVVIKRKVKEG